MVFKKENFLPNDKYSGWDGYYNGRLADAGAYVYIVEVTCNEGKPVVVKGTVMLIR